MSCFWGHRWGQWKEIYRGDIAVTGTKSVVGYSVAQERRCEKCGKVEVDSSRTMY